MADIKNHVTSKPILFSTPMVLALLDGRKTMTRRVVKPVGFCRDQIAGGIPHNGKDAVLLNAPAYLKFPACENKDCMGYGRGGARIPSPWKIGDLLWVRETWADVNSPDGPAIAYKDGDVRTWHEFSRTFGPNMGAGPSMDYDTYPGNYTMWFSDLFAGEEGHRWKPSIHMPRWASRLTLRITDVRVERVQEISEEGAMAEGIEDLGGVWRDYQLRTFDHFNTAKESFRSLWDSINAKRGFGWNVNPWVWVVSFEFIKMNVDGYLEEVAE